MSISGMLGGFACGVGVQCWAWALARKRILARPWMHLGMGIAFGYVGYNLNKWEAQLLDLLNEKRVERGMKPIRREDVSIHNYKLWERPPHEGPK